MKQSYYNHFIKLNNNEGYLAYNCRSNSLAIIEEENYNKYADFVLSNKEIDDENLVEDLKKGLFLIDDDIDELKVLRYKMYKDRFNMHSLGLTIAPTSDCNFRCIYCYEKNSIRQKDMTPQVEDAIVNFVEEQSDSIKSMTIAWYGGEPLMRFDIIERLSERIISICEKKNIQYFSSIVTNGYLLTPEILKKFDDYNIISMQITIDGRKEIHDKRRFLADGCGSFDKIFNNLKEYKELLPQVDLRINVDKNNRNDVNYIYDLLKKENLLDKVTPYLGHVKDSNNCYKDEKCVNNKDFSELTYDFQEYTNRNLKTFYPLLVTNCCGTDSLNSFVIDSDGELYKCWDEIGIKSFSVGNILDNLTINMRNINYLTLDPTLHPRCSKCKFLPICMGGCPISFASKDNCIYFKYNLEKYLTKTATELLKLEEQK